MKSILSADACQQISDSCARHCKDPPTFRANSNHCVSVTGQPLTSSHSIFAQLAFPGSPYLYEGEFLVCSNVLQPLQCILGWDFIVSHRLQLSFLGGGYVLVGPHGSTPLTPLPPSAIPPPPPKFQLGPIPLHTRGEVSPYSPSHPHGGQLRLVFKIMLRSLPIQNVYYPVKFPKVVQISLVWLAREEILIPFMLHAVLVRLVIDLFQFV